MISLVIIVASCTILVSELYLSILLQVMHDTTPSGFFLYVALATTPLFYVVLLALHIPVPPLQSLEVSHISV